MREISETIVARGDFDGNEMKRPLLWMWSMEAHYQTQQQQNVTKIWKEIDTYRQQQQQRHWLVQSLFSRFCFFFCNFIALYLLECHCFLVALVPWRGCHSAYAMTTLFENSVAIYGFVMRSSVCTLLVLTTRMRDKRFAMPIHADVTMPMV